MTRIQSNGRVNFTWQPCLWCNVCDVGGTNSAISFKTNVHFCTCQIHRIVRHKEDKLKLGYMEVVFTCNIYMSHPLYRRAWKPMTIEIENPRLEEKDCRSIIYFTQNLKASLTDEMKVDENLTWNPERQFTNSVPWSKELQAKVTSYMWLWP